MTKSSDWPAGLDALEERVRRQEQVLTGSVPPHPSAGAPTVTGPLPASLLVRALALLERHRRLEVQVEEELTRLRQLAPSAVSALRPRPYGRESARRSSFPTRAE